MKKNVLIFGGGSYSASQIYFALKDTVRFHPILASSNDNHSTFICRDAITNLPYDSDEGFIDALNRCIEENNIEFIIPSHDTAALRIMEREKDINATIVCSPLETARICRYKSLTYKKLEGMVFLPKIYDLSDAEIDFPIFAKDDIGQGGRNTAVIHNREELKTLRSNINYVLCEYLPGEEITIDCFTDRHGTIKFIQPRTRSRLLNGISARSTTIELTDEIKTIVEGIASRIEFRGYWFVQCKKDINGKYKLMEISVRFAGTFALSKNLDVNLPLLALADFSGMDVSIFPNQYKIMSDKIYIDRYCIDWDYERVYIDFDDTIVFDRERYNTEAMRFLYQCINRKKRLVLITKHAYELKETAESICFNLNMFEEIIQVPKDKMKWEYMNDDIRSIFIDNAFAERAQVKKHLNIPTFDVTNIEALIDWKE